MTAVHARWLLLALSLTVMDIWGASAVIPSSPLRAYSAPCVSCGCSNYALSTNVPPDLPCGANGQASLSQCQALCDTTPGCVGISWGARMNVVPACGVGNSWCMPHSILSSCSYNGDIFDIYLASPSPPPPPPSPLLVNAQCRSPYYNITDASRDIFAPGGTRDDSTLAAGWYRMWQGSANAYLPDFNTDQWSRMNACGTERGGYLFAGMRSDGGCGGGGTGSFGSHPLPADGVVTRFVHFDYGTWGSYASVQIVNCNGFFLYNLTPSQLATSAVGAHPGSPFGLCTTTLPPRIGPGCAPPNAVSSPTSCTCPGRTYTSQTYTSCSGFTNAVVPAGILPSYSNCGVSLTQANCQLACDETPWCTAFSFATRMNVPTPCSSSYGSTYHGYSWCGLFANATSSNSGCYYSGDIWDIFFAATPTVFFQPSQLPLSSQFVQALPSPPPQPTVSSITPTYVSAIAMLSGYTVSTFGATQATQFKSAVATALGVSSSVVTITSITVTIGRHLLQSAVNVAFTLTTTSSAASNIANAMTANLGVNSLRNAGLTACYSVAVSTPSIQTTAPGPDVSNTLPVTTSTSTTPTSSSFVALNPVLGVMCAAVGVLI